MSKSIPKRRILIVGEGLETEYNYFVGFKKEFEAELDQMATVVTVKRGKGGSARNIVKHACNAAKTFKPKYSLGDRVYLLMDTEGAGRAPELVAAEKLARQHKIEIVYSAPAFEYWLLCHFDNAKRSAFNDCAAVIVELNKKWRSVCNKEYDKSDEDIFNRLARLLPRASSQALDIDLHHIKTHKEAIKINPSSQVYQLIAILIGVMSGQKCPTSGTWKLVSNHQVTIKVQKGDTMPDHEGNPVHWRQ